VSLFAARADPARRPQFELERALRRRVLDSTRDERARITSQVYAELFDAFPDHSVFLETEAERDAFGRRCAAMIRPLADDGQRVLEVGCGRGDVLLELARTGLRCWGIEPSRHMLDLGRTTPGDGLPPVQLAQGTADRLEFDDASFDLVFSQQVLEHLHPEDVPRHFREAWRVLRPGGRLAVETPNRRTGPQDISRGFVREAEGLHLKEWSVGELIEQFRAAGFGGVQGFLAPPVLVRRSALLHRLSRVPAVVKHLEDRLLGLVPGLELRTLVGKLVGLDDVFLIGRKAPAS
jgi:SAM-dependent methyltransferase